MDYCSSTINDGTAGLRSGAFNHQSSIIDHRFPRGFSLVEVMIATLLVGLSIAALVVANGSFTMANGAGADLSTGEFLVEQIRELTAMLPLADDTVTTTWTALGPEVGEPNVTSYDDVDDLDGFDSATLGAPIDAAKTVLTDFGAFRQQVTVEKLNPSNFNEVWADDSGSDFARVTVRVSMNGREISSASWVRARY